MEITGTVTNVRTTRTDHGSTYTRMTLDDKSTLKFLSTGKTIPTRGQTVTISGVPMMGNKRANIGAATVKIHA